MRILSISRAPAALVLPAIAFAAYPRHAFADPAPGATFTRIADGSTVIPAGQWEGQNFSNAAPSPDYALPAIDNGHIIFAGKPGSSGNALGLYKWENGVLGLVADPSTTLPGGSQLAHIGSPSVHGGEYAFSGNEQAFRTVTGVPTSTGPTFVKSGPSFDGQNVWFYSEVDHPPGGTIDGIVYRVDSNGSVSSIAMTGQSAPSPTISGLRFSGLNGGIIGSGGEAVFWGESDNSASGGHDDVSGLYRYANGSIDRLVDSTMTPANGSVSRNMFDYDGDSFAFYGAGGFYVMRGGMIEPVALSGQPAPGGGAFYFTLLDRISVDNGRVAFFSGRALTYYETIYSDVDGPLARIVGVGDTLFGQTVQYVAMGPEGLSGDQIVFWAQFTDGSSGIYLATLPEPASAAALVLGLAIGFRRVGRARKSRR